MTLGHGQHLLGMIDALWAEAGVAAEAVDAVAFGCGPGAFTSLRIACAVAQGLALAWNKPVLPIDAMRTLAFQAQHAAAARSVGVWVLLDVRMGEVCHAVYGACDAQQVVWHPLAAPVLGSPSEAIACFEALRAQYPGAWHVAGDGPDAYPVLADYVRQHPALHRPPEAIQPDAAALARLAQSDWLGGGAQDAALAAPWYVRDKVALNLTEQQAARAQRVAAGGAPAAAPRGQRP
jgi:tRNA threonylcarbamoyladenosine biosynthesis protein TsaB